MIHYPELVYLDADAVCALWRQDENGTGEWLAHLLEPLREQMAQVVEDDSILLRHGAMHAQVAGIIKDGRSFWEALVTDMASACKGGKGIPNDPVSVLMNELVHRDLWERRGFANLWVDLDRPARRIRAAAFAIEEQLGLLQSAMYSVLDTWRELIMKTAADHGYQTVRLYRMVRLDPPSLHNALDESLPLRGRQGRLPLRALSAWTTSDSFASEWQHGDSRGGRVLLTADVPVQCIWLAPGSGEGELIVSPANVPRNGEPFAACPVEGEWGLVNVRPL